MLGQDRRKRCRRIAELDYEELQAIEIPPGYGRD
jgi:hypothetical protein